jgi:hypothetical protein
MPAVVEHEMARLWDSERKLWVDAWVSEVAEGTGHCFRIRMGKESEEHKTLVMEKRGWLFGPTLMELIDEWSEQYGNESL